MAHPIFSYLVEPWIPAQSDHDVRIRLIELAPSGRTSEQGGCTTQDLSDQELSKTGLKCDTLSCRISWTPLITPTLFTALSYMWGIGAMTQKIKVNNQDHHINEALETALRHLQHPTESVTMWIDQICIDQSNEDEKSEQVRQMGRIYCAAEKVLCWLGPAADNSENFMKVWSTIGKWAEDWGMLGYFTKEKLPAYFDILDGIDPADEKTMEFRAMAKRSAALFDVQILEAAIAWHKRRWFERVWVLQEYALANVVIFVCGEKRITAEQALCATQLFFVGGDISKHLLEGTPFSGEEKTRARELIGEMSDVNSMTTFEGIRNRRKDQQSGKGPGISLYTLLQTCFVERHMLASIACDTVYGLLGLANDREKLGIQVDYALKEGGLLYARTARAIIKQGNLDILSLAQHPKQIGNLPSWTPDWTSSVRPSFARQGRKHDISYFSASGGSLPELLDTSDKLVLGLKGWIVDEIEEATGIWNGEDALSNKKEKHEAYVAYLSQIKLLCLLSEHKGKDIYPSLSRRKEAIWRVPIGDIEETDRLEERRATLESAETYDVCVESLQWFVQSDARIMSEDETKGTGGWLEKPGLHQKTVQYRRFTDRMISKRPFISKDGYVGLGPQCARPGDLVVVFCGGDLPFVVRPVDAGSFRLLGECYCDGIMDGEALGSRTKTGFLLV